MIGKACLAVSKDQSRKNLRSNKLEIHNMIALHQSKPEKAVVSKQYQLKNKSEMPQRMPQGHFKREVAPIEANKPPPA